MKEGEYDHPTAAIPLTHSSIIILFVGEKLEFFLLSFVSVFLLAFFFIIIFIFYFIIYFFFFRDLTQRRTWILIERCIASVYIYIYIVMYKCVFSISCKVLLIGDLCYTLEEIKYENRNKVTFRARRLKVLIRVYPLWPLEACMLEWDKKYVCILIYNIKN